MKFPPGSNVKRDSFLSLNNNYVQINSFSYLRGLFVDTLLSFLVKSLRLLNLNWFLRVKSRRNGGKLYGKKEKVWNVKVSPKEGGKQARKATGLLLFDSFLRLTLLWEIMRKL